MSRTQAGLCVHSCPVLQSLPKGRNSGPGHRASAAEGWLVVVAHPLLALAEFPWWSLFMSLKEIAHSGTPPLLVETPSSTV